jgi:cobalt-zinc-cadmium efflux system outer membrane protein
MNQLQNIGIVIGGFLAACSSIVAQPLLTPDVSPSATAAATQMSAALAPHELLQQPSDIGSVRDAPSRQGEPLPPGKSASLSLVELEQMATTNNPAIAQAETRVAALRGRMVQVGLSPNPSIGYVASEIGDEGHAGQQGGYVSQEIVTGGKLRLNRAVVSQEIQQAVQVVEATRLRVLTDVRLAYYSALVAKRREDAANDLLQVGAKTVAESARLKDSGEIAKTGLLSLEIEQQSAQIILVTARTEREAAWRRLSSIVGTDLPVTELAGDLSQIPAPKTYDEQLARLTETSPEMAAAFSEIARSQNALARAEREPIPNITTMVSVQKDNATNDTIAGVQVGIPLPFWNRNQGEIMQAQAEISQARRNVDRVQLNLKNRLAVAFQRYSSAQERARIYSTVIMPKSDEYFKLVQGAFPAQIGSIEFLTAQRTYFQTRLAYIDALAELWASWSEIEGLLLTNSLDSKPGETER